MSGVGHGLPVEGRLVRLRDVVPDDAAPMDRWYEERDVGGFNDFGLPHEPTPPELLELTPLRNEHNGTLIVETLAGQPVGSVSWRRVHVYGPSPGSDAWQIGIELARAARGRGYGNEAQRLLADWLFAATPLYRVEASTDVENLPEHRALEKAGFVREGVLRGAQFRGGRYHDLVYYARIRSD